MIWGICLFFFILWWIFKKILFMNQQSQSAHDVLSAIMGVRPNNARPGDNMGDSNNVDPISSILFLLATDVLAGVGLRSALRSFLRSHVPLIEFSTGVHVDVHKLDQPDGQGHSRTMPNALLSSFSQENIDEDAFIIKVKGLKNRGQTCYANSVMQALASLPPLYTYLDSMQKKNAQDGGKNSNTVSLALYQTLQHINGHKVTTPGSSSTKRFATKRSFLLPIPTTTIASLFSSVVSYSTSTTPGDPQRVMDIVAKYHSQFRCRNTGMGMAGMTEQQDSHEFFSALMDVLSTEEEKEKEQNDEEDKENGDEEGIDSVAQSSTSYGLSFLRSDNHYGEGRDDTTSNDSDGFAEDYSVKIGEGAIDNEGGILSGGFTDDEVEEEEEEEKKHDEQYHDAQSADEVSYQRMATGKGTQGSSSNHKERKPASALPCHKAHTSESTIRNPFDGWSGSTIKCATCSHIRPIRSTPFLGLSLPIANIRSEYLEDFLAAEYGGFASAERVSDVQCFSCSIQQKIADLEDEEMLLDGAISSIQRRNKGKKAMITPSNGNQEDIAGLLEESQQMKRKIAILRALDPDADEDKLECRDKEDTQQEIKLGISNSLPPIVPHRGDAFKASLVMRPPEVLCIHVQRRHYDMACQRMVKVTRHVHFDEILDLGAYCAYGENSFENQQSLTNIGRPNGATIQYKLMSVVEHLGNAFGGHYQTFRRVDPEQNDWVLISDESISPRSWNDVRSCQAYMLFYMAAPS